MVAMRMAIQMSVEALAEVAEAALTVEVVRVARHQNRHTRRIRLMCLGILSQSLTPKSTTMGSGNRPALILGKHFQMEMAADLILLGVLSLSIKTR